ncbi:MAG TPA: sodium ion-translocating decarboxylase subunit beta, partial [Acidobacteriota bacterium]|nr:sodium ion-translocating decarboxylase subunit beta [Acidobacteriota bacterium]
MDFSALAGELLKGVSALGAGQAAMLAVGLFLIGLAVVKKYEPLLLLPIGAGCLLANLPLSGLVGDEGLLGLLYRLGVRTEVFPLLIFIGVGAMIDFGPLLAAPRLALLGAAGQFGIFGVLI